MRPRLTHADIREGREADRQRRARDARQARNRRSRAYKQYRRKHVPSVPPPVDLQRFSGRTRGMYALSAPAARQHAYRTFPLSAYVGVAAAALSPTPSLARLRATTCALFDPDATFSVPALADLHAYVHRRGQPPATLAALDTEAARPAVRPLQPRGYEGGRWITAVPQPPAPGADPQERRLVVPTAEVTGLRATLKQICAPHRDLEARLCWTVDAQEQFVLCTDEAAWQALDALQLMHAHRVSRAPRFPRLLKHWFARTGDAAMDRIRRAAVRRILLTWVDQAASQYDFPEHPADPRRPARALDPTAAAVEDELFGFLADAWDSVGSLVADLYATGPDEPGALNVLRTLLMVAARYTRIEIARFDLGWLVDVKLPGPGPVKRTREEIVAVHGGAYEYVRQLWLGEYGHVPVRDWIPCDLRSPICAFLSFARSPFLTPAERRRLLYAVRIPTPAVPRARELYRPRSEWRAWAHCRDTVLHDPRERVPCPPLLDADTEAQLVVAAQLLPILEYSLYFPCTPADPQRLQAPVADHGFADVPPTHFLQPERCWAVHTDAATDVVQYDHVTLLQLYDPTPGTTSAERAVHSVAQHWATEAYRAFRLRDFEGTRATTGEPETKKQRRPPISLAAGAPLRTTEPT